MSLFSVELHVTPSHASLKEPNDIIMAEKKKMLMAEYDGQKKIVLGIENLNTLRASKIKAIMFMERKGCENVTSC